MKTLLLLVMVGVGSIGFSATNYKIDTNKSQLTWKGEKPTGSHNGIVPIKKGFVKIEKGLPVGGMIILDMKNLDCLDLKGSDYYKKLVDHLKSDDFFNVKKFPEGRFKITSSKKDKTGKITVNGMLRIKGIEKPVSFPADLKLSGEKATAKADFTIDRTNWDIRYKSKKFFDIKELGDKVIYDDIGIGLDLAANLGQAKTKANTNTKTKMMKKTKKKMIN